MALTKELSLFLNLLPFAFFAMFALSALAAPIIAVADEIKGRMAKKAFLGKFAQQVSTMAVVLLALAVAALALLTFSLSLKRPWTAKLLTNPGAGLTLVYALNGVFALLAVIYKATWAKFRQKKGLHILIGLASALAGMAALFSMLAALAHWLVPGQGLSSPTQVLQPAAALASSHSTVFWTAAVLLPAQSLAPATALALCWLLFRRNRDDWGRDYYSFGLRHGAKWALYATLIELAALGAFMAAVARASSRPLTDPGIMAPLSAMAVVLLISLGIWTALMRSSNPMRLKALVIAGGLAAWSATTLSAVLYLKLFVTA